MFVRLGVAAVAFGRQSHWHALCAMRPRWQLVDLPVRSFGSRSKSDRSRKSDKGGTAKKSLREASDEAELESESDEDFELTESDSAEDSEGSELSGDSDTQEFDWKYNAEASDEEIDDRGEFKVDDWLDTPGRDVLDRGYVYVLKSRNKDMDDYVHVSKASNLKNALAVIQDTSPNRDFEITHVFEVSRSNAVEAMKDMRVTEMNVRDYVEDYFGDLDSEEDDDDEEAFKATTWLKVDAKEMDAQKAKFIRRFEEQMNVKHFSAQAVIGDDSIKQIGEVDSAAVASPGSDEKPKLTDVSGTMGYVYAITHPSHDGWTKVGAATKTPEQIERRYDAYDPDDAYEVRRAMMCADMAFAKKWIQSQIASAEGVSRKNDWFEVGYQAVAKKFKEFTKTFPNSVDMKKARQEEARLTGKALPKAAETAPETASDRASDTPPETAEGAPAAAPAPVAEEKVAKKKSGKARKTESSDSDA